MVVCSKVIAMAETDDYLCCHFYVNLCTYLLYLIQEIRMLLLWKPDALFFVYDSANYSE